MPMQDLIDHVAEFDRAAAEKAEAMADAQRAGVAADFPLDAWPDLPLERYALGTDDVRNTFCHRMEFGTTEVGSMRGGTSRRNIIFRRRSGEWYYDRDRYASVEAAWAAVRGGFVRAFDLAVEGRFDEIDAIDEISGGPALRTKATHCYFPAELLAISSNAHLMRFLTRVEDQGVATGSAATISLNWRLLTLLREEPTFDDWSPGLLARLLYDWADPREQQEQRNILKIAPGEDAVHWPACRDGGFIAFGWTRMGDLRGYEDKRSLRTAYADLYSEMHKDHRSTISRMANGLWKARELSPGDLVVANRGLSEVLAVGTVVEPGYEFLDEPAVADWRHVVRVEWDTSYAKSIPSQTLWQNTIVDLRPEVAALVLENDEGVAPAVVDPLYDDLADALDGRGQAVLYGPPGTGKTYAARRFAAWWLARGVGDRRPAGRLLADGAGREQAERELTNAGRLTWLTFHPSYSYEDFVEGFRPVRGGGGGGGGLRLELVDGVFKQACKRAADDPNRRHLVVIDEFNRANVAKVLGELITLLERDKRGLRVRLPQSGEDFAVPPNLHVLGTMNTADRSITLLDTAIRRRFAFVELMPDRELLDAEVKTSTAALHLGDFLDALNRRVSQREGREKQVGHSYFLAADGTPIEDAAEFAARFRREVLPLLQEYCYDDFATLADYLGDRLVDRDGRALNREEFEDPDRLVEALARELLPNQPAATEKR